MKISRLHLADVKLPSGHPRFGESCPVFGFVIHHVDGPILVDTGVGEGDPGIDTAYSVVRYPVDEALESVGFSPNEVELVINSHLHFDHCGNNRLFSGAELVAQSAEYQASHDPGYTLTEWVDFDGAQWRLVDGEEELRLGVMVLPTPGHTAGHQSVIVSGDDGVSAIVGQTLYNPAELDSGVSTEPLSDEDGRRTARSAQRIKAMRPERAYFSHHPGIWVGNRAMSEPAG